MAMSGVGNGKAASGGPSSTSTPQKGVVASPANSDTMAANTPSGTLVAKPTKDTQGTMTSGSLVASPSGNQPGDGMKSGIVVATPGQSSMDTGTGASKVKGVGAPGIDRRDAHPDGTIGRP